MSKVYTTARIEFSASVTLTEDECRALDAIVGYGDDAFIEAFKEKLGEAYLRSNEKGLRSFFEAVRRDVLPALRVIDQSRRDLLEAERKRQAAASPNQEPA